MADKVTFFPPAQPIRMVPYSQPDLNTYHNIHLDNGQFNKIFRRGQMKLDYAQKIQHNQNNHFTFLTSGFATVKIYRRISPTQAEYVATLADPLNYSPVSFYTAENGTTYQLGVYFRSWNFGSFTYPEGHYYVFVEVEYGDETTEQFISEPIWVRETHKNTILIHYTHHEDAFNILFKRLSINFYHRVDSDFMKLEPAADDVVFTDQDDNMRRLYSNPFRIWKLNLGGSVGIPEWLLDKLNRAFSCSTFTIDRKRFVKHENAKIEQQTWNGFPLQLATIQLREFYNDAAGSFINTVNARLTDSASFPYVISEWEMQDLVSSYRIGGGLFEFIDHDTEPYKNEQYYVDFYNSFTVPFHNLKGEFIWDDGLVYVNGDGENFATTKKADSLTVYFEATANVTATGFPVEYDMSGLGYHIAVWSDGAIDLHYEPGNNRFGAPIVLQANHYFNSTGSKTVRIYTNDKMTVLGFNPQVNKITGYDTSTAVSAKLQRFTLAGQNIDDVFDMSVLSRAKDELRILNLSGSAIHSIVAGWANALHVGSYLPWRYLRYLFLNNNKFDATAIDDFIIELVADSDYFSGWGQIYLQNQSPLTGPTGASLTPRNTLAGVFYSQSY